MHKSPVCQFPAAIFLFAEMSANRVPPKWAFWSQMDLQRHPHSLIVSDYFPEVLEANLWQRSTAAK
jgi:hypothetical protein